MSEYDYHGLDDVIHARIRLAAMAILVSVESADFTYLREKTGATDGNLGAHMRKLEEAGYVEAVKIFEDRKPVTRYSATGAGRRAFEAYVERLGRMLG